MSVRITEGDNNLKPSEASECRETDQNEMLSEVEDSDFSVDESETEFNTEEANEDTGSDDQELSVEEMLQDVNDYPNALHDEVLDDKIESDTENAKDVEDTESNPENAEDDNLQEQKSVAIENSPLPRETVEQLRGMEKGERPDPSIYLPQEMIDEHLDKFKEGGSFVMTQDQYDMYVDGNETIGCPDNSQYMTTKENMDNIFAESNGDIGVIEDRLGFDRGHFEDGGGMVRIDVDNPLELNGRMPSGNEMGANDRWIPGGQTDGPNGGSPEMVTDKIPNDDAYRHITFGL